MFSLSRYFALCLFLSLPEVHAFQVVNDHSFGSSLAGDAILGGEKVSENSRVSKMTVHLLVRTVTQDGKRGAFGCSGTFIKRDLLVTAAHCVMSLEGKFRVTQLVAYLSSGQTMEISGWRAHPSYQRINDFSSEGVLRPIHDIALVKLSNFAGAEYLLAELPSSPMKAGEKEEMLVAGFGQRDPRNPDSSGVLYFAWTDAEMKIVMAGDDYQLEMTGAQPCHGDSGGPLFRADDSRSLFLMGVTSHVKGKCEGAGRAISIAHHFSWLRKAAIDLKSPL